MIEAGAITPIEGGLADDKQRNPGALALSSSGTLARTRNSALANSSKRALASTKHERTIWSAEPVHQEADEQTVPDTDVPDWWHIFAEYDRFLLPGRIIDATEVDEELNDPQHDVQEGSLPSIDENSNPDEPEQGNLPDILIFDDEDRMTTGSSLPNDWSLITSPSSGASWIVMLNQGVSPFVTSAQVPGDLFYEPETNLARFMRVFPFDKKLMRRWRDGIRLWPSKDVIRSFPKRADPQLHEDIVALLFKRKIIEPMVKTRYVANIWFAKIDFAQAFFNINLHPKSRMVTGFQVNGTRYQFRYSPFGISIAPFVCQTLTQ